MSLSVLYLVNVPAPYRVSFFNELGLYCDLTVVFERYESSEREKEWHDYSFKTFQSVFLKGFKVGTTSTLDLSIAKFLKDNKFDIIVIGNYSSPTGILAIEYLNRKNIPFVISVDGGLIDHEESKLKQNFKTKLISSANAWLSTGETTNKYLTYYGANKEYIYIYPFTTMEKENILENPLTINEKEKLRKELHIPYSNMILSIGQFIYRKGFDVLIEAAKDFREGIGVYIIGGTPTEEYLDLIDRYNVDNVHFIDFLEYEELKKYYFATDIFVLPTREDIWGLVINEAMANGLPVITTTSCVAGIEMIEEGINGYLVPKDDVEEIIENVNKILNSDTLKQNMSLNSLEKAKEYTIENMAKKTYEILCKLEGNNTIF